MPGVAIKVKKISKEFQLGSINHYYTLRDWVSELPERLVQKRKNEKKNRFWALKDVSFEVESGEVLGIIGKNGAGKSTLLKILSRIIPPTKGVAIIHGKVASILEVGTGFHPELTGWENVYLNGAILGMKRKEINKKFKEIVDFSGIEKFLDMPVKKYSSGMQVRLAFSVAAHLDADVLLVDEVLAVGDLGFQRKSLKKMEAITKGEGRTVVFVSHNMPAVSTLCTKAILLDEGKIVKYGEPNEIISEYIEGYVPPEESVRLQDVKARSGNGQLRIVDFWMENRDRKKTAIIHTGDECYFVFKYISPDGRSKQDVDLGIALSTDMNQSLFLNYMSYTNQTIKRCPREGKFIFKIPKLPLAKGNYNIGFRLLIKGEEADYIPSPIQIKVEDGDFYKIGVPVVQRHSPMYIDGHWQQND